jgi:hypothetical protein
MKMMFGFSAARAASGANRRARRRMGLKRVRGRDGGGAGVGRISGAGL